MHLNQITEIKNHAARIILNTGRKEEESIVTSWRILSAPILTQLQLMEANQQLNSDKVDPNFGAIWI